MKAKVPDTVLPDCLNIMNCQQRGRRSEEVGEEAPEPEKWGNVMKAVGETYVR
jgi:hypothetical protein